MADQNTPPAPAPGTAPAATPPAGDPPAPAPVATPPAPAPAPRAAAPAPKKPNDRSAPFDQHPGFRKRVDQEAARIIKKKLGISLEEAIEKLAESSEPAPTPAPAGTPAAPDKRVQKILGDNTRLEARIDKLKKRLRKAKTHARDQILDMEIRHDAISAGIKAADVDYAVNLYRQACIAAGENPPDTTKFFPGLRATRSYLFTDGSAPPPVELKPTTAPPESLQPGEETPSPTGTRVAPPVKSVDDMTDQEFAAHKKKHGYHGY